MLILVLSCGGSGDSHKGDKFNEWEKGAIALLIMKFRS